MASATNSIDGDTADWIGAQHVFFVATAPSGAGGHVNCSPKGGDTLRVLGPTTIAYVDYTGSGVETIAHLRDNGRICVMLCAFDGPPRILRLHGTGAVVLPDDARFADLLSRFGRAPLGVRAVVVVEIDRVARSCGYGVPRMAFEVERRELTEWGEKKGSEGVARYWRDKNARSIDGLPGV
ncbi:MAG: pyridoxamine 5'-phosphate oxidase family protein [Planctomycetes bacterium]|nr:pyridoxamine 5'-phosphate oxidase family protein [Planctomycetota bacterium]